jgi:hypothetical protein
MIGPEDEHSRWQVAGGNTLPLARPQAPDSVSAVRCATVDYRSAVG